MKTPYDAALRLRHREIDAMRVSISVEVGQVTLLEQHRDTIDATVHRESQVTDVHHGFSGYAFAARMRAQREAVCRDRDASDGRLVHLRAQAVQAYGSLSAIAAAADRHRDEANRAAGIAEQSQIDDFSAARFARVSSARRRARSSENPGS